MKIVYRKTFLIALISMASLALFACGNKSDDIIINFNKSAYIKIADNSVNNALDIQCSYTDSIDDINNELKSIYDSLAKKSEKEGKQLEFKYKYLSVDSLYIYKISIKDNKEHTICYHNNYYNEYKQNEGSKICIIKVKDGEEPTYDTFEIKEDTSFRFRGTAYIFYGRIDNV